MYCGSCLRDNALATELIARGHDVTLLPVYTPTLTDEPNVSGRRVFFGGVSVYLQQHFPFFRHSPRWLDRLWDSSRFIRLVSRRAIQVNGEFLGGMTVSMLKGEHGLQRKELDKLIDWLKTQPAPDVVILPFALLIGLARPIREALGAKIVCTLQGEDLFLEQLVEPWKSEAQGADPRADRRGRSLHADQQLLPRLHRRLPRRAADEAADRAARPQLQGLRLPDAVRAASRAARARARSGPSRSAARSRSRSSAGSRPRRASIGSPRPTSCCARSGGCRRRGSKPPAGWAPTRSRISRRCRRGCARRVWPTEFTYRGELDRLEKVRFLARADVFSMPAPYKEPKGFTILEAMAAGVPVVQPAHGAFTEMVQKTGGGLLVKPDDAARARRRHLAAVPGSAAPRRARPARRPAKCARSTA